MEITVDATTIDTREPKLKAQLMSPDFSDEASDPIIPFKSTKIETAGKSKYKVTGDLNVHGVTKQVARGEGDRQAGPQELEAGTRLSRPAACWWGPRSR